MNKTILVVIIIIIAAAAIYGLSQTSKTAPEDTMMNDQTEDKVMDDGNISGEEIMENEQMIDYDDDMDSGIMDDEDSIKSEEMIDDGKEIMMNDNQPVGSYEAYAPEKLAKADNGNVVLFFHANWCPTCRALNSSLEGSLSEIPSDLTILKTDYDSETALKQKYGVTYQHTLVKIDSQGNMLKKWSGSRNLEEIISQL
ncbi:MAG: hypothetical protein COU22_02605 [Candidatus Komeilibacteria bacterium CG10_big_fil_rev_8_21_14_0_10_41_13]|uniref:Thioredoxin domain-containing protein n=1 Tax=Candidatus Komeilibacteria bacterium CG10_big_fil_rev_8_21_14_0_10_41_13 TaxID=1974476 RepID=A0A2M6WC31_9BACT|nr:MAG: hypothetical protein COU22_02605 [Candidatus Komeilibacteria bacterium CG10_big_fil_rev_8_21_14_0_10_41_13]